MELVLKQFVYIVCLYRVVLIYGNYTCACYMIMHQSLYDNASVIIYNYIDIIMSEKANYYNVYF